MNTTLELYNKVRQVPIEAKKPIQGGRLKGFTDINPMWRIKVLTEQFGACGQGWYYEITNKEIVEGANGEKVAFLDLNLYVNYGDGHGEEWSKPIPGTGGSSFIAKERSGLYTSDECYKMALTDALGVAMKSLGVAADVYFEKDRSKYDKQEDEPLPQAPKVDTISEPQQKRLFAISQGNNDLVKEVLDQRRLTSTKEIKKTDYEGICKYIEARVNKGE